MNTTTKTKKLSYEEKWAEIKTLIIGADVKMRSPGDWYVCAGMEHVYSSHSNIGDYGNGTSPRTAIEDHWRQYADGRPFLCRGAWYVRTATGWMPTSDPRL